MVQFILVFGTKTGLSPGFQLLFAGADEAARLARFCKFLALERGTGAVLFGWPWLTKEKPNQNAQNDRTGRPLCGQVVWCSHLERRRQGGCHVTIVALLNSPEWTL